MLTVTDLSVLLLRETTSSLRLSCYRKIMAEGGNKILRAQLHEQEKHPICRKGGEAAASLSLQATKAALIMLGGCRHIRQPTHGHGGLLKRGLDSLTGGLHGLPVDQGLLMRSAGCRLCH